MTPNEYLEKSARTDLDLNGKHYFRNRATVIDGLIDLLHATMGISTEAGELLDAMKKHLAYGRPVDKVNIAEECGDVLWYIAIILRHLDMTFEECMEMNINKLEKRFPEKFTSENAINRDLTTEREQLENDFKVSSSHLIGE